MNDKKYNILTAIARELPSDGSVLKYKGVASIVTKSQWRSCCKWFKSEAGDYVRCEKSRLSLQNGQTVKGVLEFIKSKNIKLYNIGYVSNILDIPITTIRFWGNAFEQLKPERMSSGLRKYKPEDIEVCKLIKHLLRDKGYSLEYAKREMIRYAKYLSHNDLTCDSADEAIKLLQEVADMVDGNPYAEMRIKAVEKWIKNGN